MNVSSLDRLLLQEYRRTLSIQLDDIFPPRSYSARLVDLITSKPDLSISSFETVGGFT